MFWLHFVHFWQQSAYTLFFFILSLRIITVAPSTGCLTSQHHSSLADTRGIPAAIITWNYITREDVPSIKRNRCNVICIGLYVLGRLCIPKVAWPSGLRRWFKAPVISMAWVRIPPLPIITFTHQNVKIQFCIVTLFIFYFFIFIFQSLGLQAKGISTELEPGTLLTMKLYTARITEM